MFVVTEPATIAQSTLETKTCCKRPERVGREFCGYTGSCGGFSGGVPGAVLNRDAKTGIPVVRPKHD